MNVKHLPLYLGLGFTLAVSGVVSQAPQAQAQSGNQSDITGVIVTTSDIAGGFNFSGGDRRRLIAFQSTSIQNAVNSASVSINQRLGQGTLPIVATDSSQTSISVTVQQNLQIILINEGNVSTSVTQYVNGLVSAGADRTLSQNLVTSLVGLTSDGTVQAAQCQRVIRAYNVFIENSTIELLTNNPDELRAIRSVLAVLLNAAYASR